MGVPNTWRNRGAPHPCSCSQVLRFGGWCPALFQIRGLPLLLREAVGALTSRTLGGHGGAQQLRTHHPETHATFRKL